MRLKVDDYTVKHTIVQRDEFGGASLVPLITLHYNGGVVWQGASWSVAHYMKTAVRRLGSCPWRESLDIEIRLVGVDGDYRRYTVC